MRSDLIDLSGRTFGRWLVKEYAGRNKHHQNLWLCLCECGTERIVRGQGKINSQSCGCLQRDRTAELSKIRNKTHGGSRTRLYTIWSAMKRRCLNAKVSEYRWYGGRGIRVCQEWNSFENFKMWAVNSGYRHNLTLDRKDTNKDYTPSNCRWIPLKEQAANRRNNILVEYKNEEVTLAQLARITGESDKKLYQRYSDGARTLDELLRPNNQRLAIEYEGKSLSLAEISKLNGLSYQTVWKRYKNGARSYESLSKRV